MKQILAKKDNWETGATVPLFIPEYNERLPTGSHVGTLTTLTAEYPNHVSPGFTVFTQVNPGKRLDLINYESGSNFFLSVIGSWDEYLQDVALVPATDSDTRRSPHRLFINSSDYIEYYYSKTTSAAGNMHFSFILNGTTIIQNVNLTGNAGDTGGSACFLPPFTGSFSGEQATTVRIYQNTAQLTLNQFAITSVPTNSLWFGSGTMAQVQAFYNAVENWGVGDPYEEGFQEVADVSGGDGTWYFGQDNIDFPQLPTLSAVNTGFISMFRPTTTQLKQLGNYMWSTMDLTVFKRLFNDPMESIIGLNILPFAPDVEASPKNVVIGNIDTGIQMPYITNQYKIIDCGTLTLPNPTKTYLDYNPYTKIDLFLPYIGIVNVDVDEIMGKTIAIKYYIDCYSGSCTALIKCGSTILYSFNGNCVMQIPITGQALHSLIGGMLTACKIITAPLSGGFPLPFNGGAVNIPYLQGAQDAAVSTLSGIKSHVSKSGSTNATNGFFTPQKPYFIITSQQPCIPESQNEFTGYPAFITGILKNFQGFTKVYAVHLENISCTEKEQTEIFRLLREGVIV